ncbi:MAG: 50S ribosomal protein L15 [Patescibacteria group bacterium]|jgi:large subunit ribosomal protein L15|nr:50S ribosomal protein L15 [Patescibacteria group bacterium]
MALSLNTIKAEAGSTKKRRRVGRGNASGTGTYSGKGQKGQKSRSGVSGLKKLGMKQTLLRTPKMKGFKSIKPKDQVINISELNKYFKESEIVNAKTLLKNGLVNNYKKEIKILGNGVLKIKNLKFHNIKLSDSAREKAEKLGAKITIEKKKNSAEKTKSKK